MNQGRKGYDYLNIIKAHNRQKEKEIIYLVLLPDESKDLW